MPSTLLARLEGPLRLVLDEPADPAARFWVMVAVLGGAAMVSGTTAIYLLWRRSLVVDPADYAFRRLARRLGMAQRERRLLRQMAEEQGVPPVALLMSPWALRRVLEGARGGESRAVGRLRVLAGSPEAG